MSRIVCMMPTCADLAREVSSDCRFRARMVPHYLSKVDHHAWWSTDASKALEVDDFQAAFVLGFLADKQYSGIRPERVETPHYTIAANVSVEP